MSESAADRPIVDAEPAQRVDDADVESREERARRSGYRSRFGAIYFALAIVAGAGVGALVVLVLRPEPAPPPAWSGWQPSGSDVAKVRQIADRVSTAYRAPSGNQLVVATVESPPRVTINADAGALPITRIFVRPDTSKGRQEEGDIAVVETSESVIYNLCGLGSEDCSIAEGESSPERHALLRREALELALYTFRYVEGVDKVAVFLPPPPPPANSTDTRAPQTSVFLRRSDVREQLRRPLVATLLPRPPTVADIPPREYVTVNRITLPRTYTHEYTYSPPDNSMILVLTPAT